MITAMHDKIVKIPTHPHPKYYYAGECFWTPDRGWRVRGSGNPGTPCTWIGHPWGDKPRESDEEAEAW